MLSVQALSVVSQWLPGVVFYLKHFPTALEGVEFESSPHRGTVELIEVAAPTYLRVLKGGGDFNWIRA